MTFFPNEWILADPAYIGCPHCAVKYPKKKLCGVFTPCAGPAPGRRSCSCAVANTPFEVEANHVFDGLRCRAEKLIAKVAVLGLFHNGKCRLGYRMLLATVKLSMHTAAVWSRLHPQYDGYGDWAHF